jgi:group I intron endonuclease
MLNVSGIYRITSPSGKFYIGSSLNIAARWRQHRSDLRRNLHVNPKLQAAWNKYSEDNLKLEIVEVCLVEDLLNREQHYLDTLKPTYNIATDATSPMKGKKHTEEAKKKMSQPGELNPFYGKTLSAEHRAVLDRTGTKHKPETLEKYKQRIGTGNTFFGRKHNEESREKMSKKALGRKLSPETKAKIAKASKGENNGNYGNVGVYKHSAEAKAKMSKASKAQVRAPFTAERKAKISAAAKGRVCKPLSEEQKLKLSILAKSRWAAKKAQENG